MKKWIFSLILIFALLFPVSTFSEENGFLYSFSSAEDADIWPGCFYDESIMYEDGYSAFVINPFGETKNNTITHVIDYRDKVYLQAGKTYTFSGSVMNPLNDNNQTVVSHASLEDSANTVIVTVSGANSGWQKFSTTFYAGYTGEYNLSVHFLGGSIDFGFFIDELSFKETPCVLSSIKVDAPSEVLIPASNDIQIKLVPYLVTSDGVKISILSSGSIVSSCNQAQGISYKENSFTLTVSKDALSETQLSVDFALHNYAHIPLYTHNITLTDNMIENSSFDDDLLLWESSSDISYKKTDENSFISLPTNDYGDYGYFSTITYSSSELLLENVVYVLRAKVKSDSVFPAPEIYAKNTSHFYNNTVYFDIKDISSNEWTDVFAAFIPDASGIYDIAINLYSLYDATIYIDNITLASEVLKPEYITLHAPGNITVPDIETSYPVSALLRDQLGNVIDTENIIITLNSDEESISFDAETLTVFPDTTCGDYLISAHYSDNPQISAQLPFTVSFDYIGDGSFEEKHPNEWWMVTSPYESDFYIRNDGHSKRALVKCEGDYFILLNNSYVHLIENVPYAFNAEFSSAYDCTATLFIEALDSSVYPLMQMYIKSGTVLEEKLTPELFLQEQSIVGRLFLYIQAEDGQPFSVYLDNLSLKKASIIAGVPHISGQTTVNGTAEAQFSFYNSITQTEDTSSCLINWFISSSPDYGFTMLPNFGKNIYFDTTFLNKYVCFEVIPVCPVTGFSGNAVRSLPVMITYESDSQKSIFNKPRLSSPDKNFYFYDTISHWGESPINILAHNGIINGKSENLFYPEDYITRAEFSKLLSSAFSVKTTSDFSAFTDIDKNDWFYSYVTALNITGIINGTSDQTFAPYEKITRQDAAVMIMRIYEKLKDGLSSGSISFSDSNSVSAYAHKYVHAAGFLGIILGNPDGAFYPQKNITRAEAATMLIRAISKL